MNVCVLFMYDLKLHSISNKKLLVVKVYFLFFFFLLLSFLTHDNQHFIVGWVSQKIGCVSAPELTG